MSKKPIKSNSSERLSDINKLWIVIYCGGLLSLAAFSIDTFLPAFDLMVEDFNSSYSDVQLSITVYLFSFGLWQLIFGSISDRYGRRKIILLGLCIFIIANILSFNSSSVQEFLLYRFLQGIGVGATTVCSRAIIRDLFSGKDLVRMMGIVAAVFAIGPMLGPILGSLIIKYFDWNIIIVVVIAVTICLVFLLNFIPETNNNKNIHATSFAYVKSSTNEILANKKTCFYLIICGLMLSILIFLVVNSPLIYERYFGIAGLTFAGFFALQGIGNFAGHIINMQLIKKFSSEMICFISSLVIVNIAAVIFLFADVILSPIYFTFVSAVIIAFALVLFANVTSIILDPHGRIIGFTSAVLGAASQIISAVLVSVLAKLSDGSISFLSLAMLGTSTVICLLILFRLFIVNNSSKGSSQKPNIDKQAPSASI